MKTATILFCCLVASSTLAHTSWCHRWHSCPSDSGSYICGDLGYCSACPDNQYCSGGNPISAPETDLLSTEAQGSGSAGGTTGDHDTPFPNSGIAASPNTGDTPAPADTPANLPADHEDSITKIYCTSLGGTDQSQHQYQLGTVRVDCETADHVIEAGLDTRSSLDSLQQAIFFATLTNKTPVVVIYDTDNREGKYEFRIREACEFAGVEYRVVALDEIIGNN